MDSHFHGNIGGMGMTETSNEIATLSSKAHDNRGTNINHIYLQMGKIPSFKSLI